MITDAYMKIGVALALLGSNLCLLLLVLNALSWINFLHMDVAPIENFVEAILSPWRVHFQTATAGWLVFSLLVKFRPAKSATGGSAEKKQSKLPLRRSVILVVSVAGTLALPHLLAPHQHRHPVLRRSLVGDVASVAVGRQSDAAASDAGPAPAEQELVFTVDKMTCGGCGSHVRNLAEANLSGQKTPSSAFTVSKVQVDWRAGVMSIYGTRLTDSIDREAIAATLGNEGYPTSFLYSQ
ncbi:hypothetical protein ACHAWF_005181 [Thalassiosira exigua]